MIKPVSSYPYNSNVRVMVCDAGEFQEKFVARGEWTLIGENMPTIAECRAFYAYDADVRIKDNVINVKRWGV